jgi:plasmid maintenance system antidote protein VapI
MREQAKVLSEANEVTRSMVKHYLQKHEISLNAFSKLVEVRQPNLHKFINGSSLSSKTIEKLGEFFSK